MKYIIFLSDDMRQADWFSCREFSLHMYTVGLPTWLLQTSVTYLDTPAGIYCRQQMSLRNLS